MVAGPGIPARLAAFVAVSACLHALVLLVPVTSIRSKGPQRSDHGAGLSVQLRLAQASVAKSPLAAGATPPVPAGAPSREMPEATSGAIVPGTAPEATPATAADTAVVPPADADPPGDRTTAGDPEPPADWSPAIPVPQIVDSEYLPARLLDVYPRMLVEVPMVYPDAAASLDLSGRVTLLLLIDELGTVVDVTVIEADPAGYFEEAAVETFRGVLFSPGMRNGHPVKSRLLFELSFDARTESARGSR